VLSRPRVGVTGPDRGGRAAWWATHVALARSGARAVRITPSRPCEDPSTLSALVVGGGADVDPQLYDAPELPTNTATPSAKARFWGGVVHVVRRLSMAKRRTGLDHARDAMETELVRHMLTARKPILGICRGAQLINVVLGGSLFQDLGSFYAERPNPHTVLPKKRVAVDPESRLHALVGRADLRVNALHKQAIKDVAPALRRVAVESNGVTQAVEARDGFVVGVQWHPEYMPQSAAQLRIFGGLVAAAQTPSS
jgi:putative glutamine amidotransferase